MQEWSGEIQEKLRNQATHVKNLWRNNGVQDWGLPPTQLLSEPRAKIKRFKPSPMNKIGKLDSHLDILQKSFQK